MGKRILIVAVGIWLYSLACFAQQAQLKGKVVTPDGQPAAGALIHVIQMDHDYRTCLFVASTQSDGRGEFSFPSVGEDKIAEPWLSVGVMGWKPGLAPCEPKWIRHGALWPDSLVLTLHHPGERKGMVLDAQGKPVKNARLEPRSVSFVSKEKWVWEEFRLPQSLASQWAVSTSATGEFALTYLVPRGFAELTIQAPGFARQRVRASRHDFREQEDLVYKLPKASVIRGLVRCPDPEVKLSGLRVVCWVTEQQAFEHEADEITADAEGRFMLEAMTPGVITVSVQPGPGSEWQPECDQRFTLAEGENKEGLVFDLKKATRVSGRVVECQTRAPLAGVNMGARIGRGSAYRPVGRTDAEGRYSFYTAARQATVYVGVRFDAFLYPDKTFREVQLGSEPVTVPDFELRRTAVLDGVVLDERGHPVSGAQVIHATELRSDPRAVNTDGQGRFRLPGLHPDKPIPIWARTKTAFSPSLTVTANTQKEPLRIVLAEGTGVRLKGRVIDSEGNPVRKAYVMPRNMPNLLERVIEPFLSDEKGVFDSGPLWPQFTYELQVGAEKHTPAITAKWEAQPGKVHDFGDIVLMKEGGFLSGRVLDSTGNPVAAAHVWNPGDASQRIQTKSAVNGAFKLDGLRDGYAYAFAEKDGFRLAGARARAGTKGLVLTLYREDEKPPVSPVSPPRDLDRAQSQELARKLLDLGLAQVAAENDEKAQQGRRAELAGLMARIDPVRAKALSAQDGNKYDTEIALALAEQALKRDVPEAMAYLRAANNPERERQFLLSATEKAAGEDPEKAKQLIGYAVPAIRAMVNVPWRTAHLAKLGKTMVELGVPGGREMLDECMAVAGKLGADGSEAGARAEVAEQLCRLDLEAALGLLRPLKDSPAKARYLTNIAWHIGDKDPDRAEDLVAEIKDSWQRDEGYALLACRVAKTDLDRAQKVVNKIGDVGRARVLAYTWMARELAEADKPKACALLDKAISIPLGFVQGKIYYAYFEDAALTFAKLALVGAEIGHPEAPSMALRALSLRRDIASASMPDWWDRDGAMVIALAAADSTAGRELLETIIPQVLSIPEPHRARAAGAVNDLALAALIVDPGLCERFLAQLSEKQMPFDCARLVEYLLADAKEKRETVRRAIGVW